MSGAVVRARCEYSLKKRVAKLSKASGLTESQIIIFALEDYLFAAEQSGRVERKASSARENASDALHKLAVGAQKEAQKAAHSKPPSA